MQFTAVHCNLQYKLSAIILFWATLSNESFHQMIILIYGGDDADDDQSNQYKYSLTLFGQETQKQRPTQNA